MVTAREEQKGKLGPRTRQLARAPLSPVRESISHKHVPRTKENQLVSGNPHCRHLQETQNVSSSTRSAQPTTERGPAEPRGSGYFPGTFGWEGD